MARSTKAEVARRVAEIFPLVCDCMTLREIRAFADAKTDWGRSISDAQLKRYLAKARKLMSEAALFDRQEEFGAARRRLERIIARAAAKGDLRTLLTANRQLCELLGLATPARLELSGPDGVPLAATAADIRAQFEDLIEAKSARLSEEESS
ncbi:MAG TPA: hypothetical protein VIL79_03695 [Thermoleophilia bacterium]